MYVYLSPAEAKRFYDRLGSGQDWQSFFENPAINELIAHAAFDSAHSVIEFSCGTGALAASLLQQAAESENCWRLLSRRTLGLPAVGVVDSRSHKQGDKLGRHFRGRCCLGTVMCRLQAKPSGLNRSQWARTNHSASSGRYSRWMSRGSKKKSPTVAPLHRAAPQ